MRRRKEVRGGDARMVLVDARRPKEEVGPCFPSVFLFFQFFSRRHLRVENFSRSQSSTGIG